MSEETVSDSRPQEDILLDLNFVPQWARKQPGADHYRVPEEMPGGRRGDRREGRGGRPARDSNGPAARPRRPAQDRPPAEHPVRRSPPPAERIELPVQIRFLPEQDRLGSVVRQIHHSNRAYPLMDLAAIFLSDPKAHLVKIEAAPEAAGFKMYQGRRSRMVATDRDVLLRQILDEHLDEFFTREEIQTDPPSGVFPCIAKVDDILIGPPNHHSYADRLAEIHRNRYPGLPFDRFKQKVQTVRDEALTEQWKQESSRKTVYRLKDAPEGEAKEFSLVQAEEYIRTHIAGTEIEEVSRAVISSDLARKIRDVNLLRMVRDAWQAESRFPLSLSFALRAAFRHLHLHSFKAGKNITFVTAVKPDPIVPEKAVETIRAVLEFLAEHPGSTRGQLAAGLRPGAAPDSPEAHEILNPIRWLVEKGHLIEFFNGTLAVPSHRRRKMVVQRRDKGSA